MPALAKLFPEAKVICCVRNVPAIMGSFERIFAKNPLELSGIFGFDRGTTVYNRVNRLASGDGLVGFALDALRDAFYGDFSDRILLVDYEALVKEPQRTMGALYWFVGADPFRHDFDNVEYSAEDFDAALGTPGLHTVRKQVSWVDQRSPLPPELASRFVNDSFWNREDQAHSRATIVSMHE